MPINITPSRAMRAYVDQLRGNLDLPTEKGELSRVLLDELTRQLEQRRTIPVGAPGHTGEVRLDFLCMNLTSIALDLLELPDLEKVSAVSMYTHIRRRLDFLVEQNLLSPARRDELLVEVKGMYAKYRPELLPLLPAPLPESATHVPA
jgi:hypothetical protein